MEKFILIPDSFKGTMDSMTLCGIMEKAIRKHFPESKVVSLPVGDGGEGTVDSFLYALGGERIKLEAAGPNFEPVDSFYGLLDGGSVAVIEMAAAAGLPLAGPDSNPLDTSTYGVGQLILDAASRKVEKIVLGLGGSATNDGGCGLAAALGVRFLDDLGQSFIPVGGSLEKIRKIDLSGLHESLAGIRIVAMCDIDNPLYGPEGAAHVFAPQKGADKEETEVLDAGLRHLAERFRLDLGSDPAFLPGAGAAGGMGAGVHAFLGASLERGIEVVLDTVGFESRAQGADLVLTGEGKIDRQSLRGKVVAGVARRAARLGVPVAAIVGDIGDDLEDFYEAGVSGIFSINRVAADLDTAKARSREDLYLTVDNLMRFMKRMKKNE